MTASVVCTRFGRPATVALARAVQEAQVDDPLAPVTVVVPSNLAGLTARRLLGSGELAADGGPSGIANVSFATPYQLAVRLGSGAVAERGTVPLTNAVLGSAIRRVLAEEPGMFDGVHAHAATETALVGAYAELSDLSTDALGSLEAVGGLTGEVVRVYRSARARLHGFHDENDIVRAATAAVRADTIPPAELGQVVLYLVDEVSPTTGELIDALAYRGELVAIVGFTGNGQADVAAHDLVERLGGRSPQFRHHQPPPASSAAPDATEEARRATRGVLEAAGAGVPFDRIAILYPAAEPYARIVHEQLDAAAVPWNGPALPRLADSVSGRVLLRLLDLTEGARFDRDDVIELVSTAPVTTDSGRWAPAAAWDRTSRKAGVIGGLHDWTSKLARRRVVLEQRIAEPGADTSEGRVERLRTEVEIADSLERFVVGLGQAVGSPPADWVGRCAWARDLLHTMLGAPGRRTGWPDEERDAGDRVEDALEELSILDAIEPDVTFEIFHRAVTSQLDRPARRHGRFGHGVLVSSLQLAGGLDVDIVFVLGLAEGVCPRSGETTPCFPTGFAPRPRASSRIGLSGWPSRIANSSLASPLVGWRPPSSIRGDHRTGRASFPSRWFLDQVEQRVGHRVLSRDLHTLPGDVIETIPSFTAGLGDGQDAPSLTDHDLAQLAMSVGAGGQPIDHPVVGCDLGLARGLEAITTRRSPTFSRWDGNLDGQPVPDPFAGAPLSPTRLETWATCPRKFLLSSLLRVREVERPDDIEEIGAADKGSLVHAVLEKFVEEAIHRPEPERLAPGQPWSDADRDRLHEIALQLFDEFEGDGVTGRPLLWEAVQTRGARRPGRVPAGGQRGTRQA